MKRVGADVFSRTKRSEVMAHIRGAGNLTTEVALLGIMRKHRIAGWRRRYGLLGKPDFVFPVQRVAVFVDGCFWHGCPRHGGLPKGNRAFWAAKLGANVKRDRRVANGLRRLGWQVMRIWEHDLCRHKEAAVARRLKKAIEGMS